MTTPDTSVPTSTSTPGSAPGHAGLRLRLADRPGNELDGGWWPHSRDLSVELAQLVDDFPREHGRVVRAHYSPPDWDPAPRRVPVIGGWIKIGGFPHDDTHLILLKTSDRRQLRILVVPPDFSPDQGEEALLAAATDGNAHSAASLLHLVTDQPEVDQDQLWHEETSVDTPVS